MLSSFVKLPYLSLLSAAGAKRRRGVMGARQGPVRRRARAQTRARRVWLMETDARRI